KVRSAQPVDEVVPRFGVRATEVGGFVARVTVALERRDELLVRVGLRIVGGQRAASLERGIAERRSRLGNEAVRRHVLGIEREGCVDRARPTLGVVAGEAV